MSIPITGPASGFRDMYGDAVRNRESLLYSISQTFEAFGYEPLVTPLVERISTLRSKGGAETEKLIYKVLSATHSTAEEAELGLRFDLTVPLARFTAQYGGHIQQQLPFRRYAIGEVFRGERPQAGRYRSFMQCDADVVGEKGMLADAEILMLVQEIFEKLNVSITIRLNNRKIIDGLCEVCALDHEDKKKQLTILLDNYYKVGQEKTLKTVQEIFGEQVRNTVEKYICVQGDTSEILTSINTILGTNAIGLEGIEELKKVIDYLGSTSINIVIDPTIARGLDYYTGTIFETFIDEHTSIGSICSGGRYDNLIHSLGGLDVPAVGMSVGIDRLLSVYNYANVQSLDKRPLYVVTMVSEHSAPYALAIAKHLVIHHRKVQIILDPDKKLSAQLSHASKIGAQYAIIAGPEEQAKNLYLEKNLTTGQQQEVAFEY